MVLLKNQPMSLGLINTMEVRGSSFQLLYKFSSNRSPYLLGRSANREGAREGGSGAETVPSQVPGAASW